MLHPPFLLMLGGFETQLGGFKVQLGGWGAWNPLREMVCKKGFVTDVG